MATASRVDQLLDDAGMLLVDGFGDVAELQRALQSIVATGRYAQGILERLADKLDGDGELAQIHVQIRHEPALRRARRAEQDRLAA